MRDANPLAGAGSGLSGLLTLKFLAQEINKLVLTDIILSSIHMLMDVLPPGETLFLDGIWWESFDPRTGMGGSLPCLACLPDLSVSSKARCEFSKIAEVPWKSSLWNHL